MKNSVSIAQDQVSVDIEHLRDWLEAHEFQFVENHFRGQKNDCKWYAWKRSNLEARDCDCNGPKMQIVLTPHSYELIGLRYVRIEADVTGEYDGVWYKLQAYSMTPLDVVARIDDVEAALIRAWNSLKPNVKVTGA